MPGGGSEYKSIEEVRSILYPGSALILDLEKEDVLEFPANLTGAPAQPAARVGTHCVVHRPQQRSPAAPSVHLDHDGNATTFHVHGGGLVISRTINECGIAKEVAATIEEASGTAAH